MGDFFVRRVGFEPAGGRGRQNAPVEDDRETVGFASASNTTLAAVRVVFKSSEIPTRRTR